VQGESKTSWFHKIKKSWAGLPSFPFGPTGKYNVATSQVDGDTSRPAPAQPTGQMQQQRFMQLGVLPQKFLYDQCGYPPS
jgi:hypothetical protein